MKMKRTAVLALLALTILFSLAVSALASAGRFTAIEGRVDVLRPGEQRAVPARKGDEVSPGDFVRTKNGSFAEIVFMDDTILRISQNTRIEIKSYDLTVGNERKSGVLRLLRGKIRATVPRVFGSVIPVSGKSSFDVETPTAVAGVRGTDFFIFHSRMITGLFVNHGAVDSYNILFPEDVQRVPGGYYTVIHQDRGPSIPAPFEDFEYIRHERDTSPDGALRKRAYEEAHGPGGGIEEALFQQEEHAEAEPWVHERVERPVTEEHTALLESGEPFSGDMTATGAFSTYALAMTATVTGEWEDDGTWTMAIDGTFTDTCPGGCSYSGWTGSLIGTNADSTAVIASMINGVWANGSWSADIGGTKANRTGLFSGSIWGTYSGTTSGTFTGQGSP